MAAVVAPCPDIAVPCPDVSLDTAAVKDAIATTGEKFFLGATAGFLGGVCQTYVGQPFDTVKVRMQTSAERHGFFRTAFLTLRHEGVRGLYHGTTPALIFGLLENTIAFGVNEQLKRYLMKRQAAQGSRKADLSMEQLALCGAAGGLVHCVFSCPTEVVKCKLQVTGSSFRGPIDCFQSTLRMDGIPGLYKGFTPFVLREVPFYLCFFATYELICGKMQRYGSPDGSLRKRDSLSTFEVICAGGFAGMVGWSGVQPFDTAMVRMQTGKGAGGECGSFLQTCGAIYRSGGWRGFFPGWIPAMLRAFPANAALFVGFEGSRRALNSAFAE
jgi:hypothetical protein